MEENKNTASGTEEKAVTENQGANPDAHLICFAYAGRFNAMSRRRIRIAVYCGIAGRMRGRKKH